MLSFLEYFVFFGAVFQKESYYKIMCNLRLSFKKFHNKGEQAFDYMQKYTSYRSQSEIDSAFSRGGFQRITVMQVLQCHPRKLFRTISKLPFANTFFGLFRTVVVGYQFRGY